MGLALLLALPSSPPPPAAGTSAGPHIVVVPPTFDFGKVRQGAILNKEFSVRNFGRETLAIQTVSTTCGCTAALPDRKAVPPGGSTLLRVTVRMSNDLGRFEARVLVRSNDAETPVLEIKVLATIVAG